MKIGFIPTDLNARTGEFTPPGIKSTASLYASIEFVKFFTNDHLKLFFNSYSVNHFATSFAKYVMIISAPARFIAVNFSMTNSCSLIHPFIRSEERRVG